VADRDYGAVVLWGPAVGPVRVTSASGRIVIDGTALDSGVPGVAAAHLVLPASPRDDGVWTAAWADGSLTRFTVGRGIGAGTLLEAVLQVCDRLGPVWRGRASEGTRDSVIDPGLVGLGAVAGYFLLRLSGPEKGHFRRITADQLGVLYWDRPFFTPIQAGEEFAVVSANPERVKAAVLRALEGLSPATRVPLTADDIPVPESRVITVPEGWEGVSGVWATLEDGSEKKLIPTRWRTEPGRKLRIVREPAEVVSVSLEGFRSGMVPAFWDSNLDRDTATVASLAAAELYLSLAGGPAIDPDDRMRKAVLAIQESEKLRLTRRFRWPSSAKAVIP